MVMRITPIERLKTAPKNWLRNARMHTARMKPDVRFAVGSFKGKGVPEEPEKHIRKGAMRMGHAHNECAWSASAFPRNAGARARCAETCSCAAGQKVINQAEESWLKNCQGSARGGFFCGQPVQNLCPPWAQYIGAVTIETHAAFLSKNMVNVAAIIDITS
jgi:hypothetical protein